MQQSMVRSWSISWPSWIGIVVWCQRFIDPSPFENCLNIDVTSPSAPVVNQIAMMTSLPCTSTRCLLHKAETTMATSSTDRRPTTTPARTNDEKQRWPNASGEDNNANNERGRQQRKQRTRRTTTQTTNEEDNGRPFSDDDIVDGRRRQ